MPTTPEAFIAACKQSDVAVARIDPKGGFISLTKRFPAGDAAAYAQAEGDVGVIYSVPATAAGSTWGTDGGSVGGAIGLAGGYMTLNRTGCSKRFLAAVAKALASA